MGRRFKPRAPARGAAIDPAARASRDAGAAIDDPKTLGRWGGTAGEPVIDGGSSSEMMARHRTAAKRHRCIKQVDREKPLD